jgi:hypothetical protein
MKLFKKIAVVTFSLILELMIGAIFIGGVAWWFDDGLYLPGFSATRSTAPIAYESRPTNGKRDVLFADGRIEQLTDHEIREPGFDPDPLTRKERTSQREEREKKEEDDFIKRNQEKLAQNEKEKEEKAKREREKINKEVEKAWEEMARKQKEFEEQQRRVRQQEDDEIEKDYREMDQKRKEIEEKQQTERAKPKPSGPARGGKVNPRTTPGTRALRANVSLRYSYPQSYPGAPTNKISVQYAAIELLKQAGVEHDFKKSQANVRELARRWITPNIVDQPCATALAQVLGSVGLTYELVGNKVVLKRK